MTRTLGIDVPRARGLLRREVVPSDSEIAALSDAWGLEPAAFLTASDDDASRALTEPEFKPLLDQVMAEKGMDEVTARRRSQREYAFAARAAQPGYRMARMRAAIERVLRSDGAS